MGLFSFLGETTAELVGSAIGEHKKNKRIQKNQASITGNQGMIYADKIEAVSAGKQTVYDMRLVLYKEGLEEFYSTSLINVLNKYSKEKFDLYSDSVTHVKHPDMSKIFAWTENKCNEIFLNKRINENDWNYVRAFENAKSKLIAKIKDKIISRLKGDEHEKGSGFYLDYRMIVYLLSALRFLTNDDRYMPAIEAVNDINCESAKIYTHLWENEYGSFDIDLYSCLEEEEVPKPEMLKRVIEKCKNNVFLNNTGYFEGIAEYMSSARLNAASALLWHYADKTPFEKENFYNAVNEVNMIRCGGNDYNAFECVLAEIYIKNKLGGEDLVRQNIDEIMSNAEIRNPIFARKLCSFLAYLGAYNVEYEVLKRVVDAKIELTQEMQDRLSFLANGGTSSKLKIYNVQNTDKFLFDSSTDGWSAEDFEALLSKFRMDRKTLNYSLLINSWKKTLPLVKGKKFSTEALHNEFINLMDDFDGEITYERTAVSAVNMDNINYDDCALFRFCTNRNKGLSMLFNCEKFGRNLNITISTLFTPSDDIANDEMIGCIKSILSSTYVDSFRESILQTVDESMKEKEDIYEEKLTQASPKMFE